MYITGIFSHSLAANHRPLLLNQMIYLWFFPACLVSRYFLLVVALQVQAQNQTYLVAAHSSERIIVRVINITLLYNKQFVLMLCEQLTEVKHIYVTRFKSKYSLAHNKVLDILAALCMLKYCLDIFLEVFLKPEKILTIFVVVSCYFLLYFKNVFYFEVSKDKFTFKLKTHSFHLQPPKLSKAETFLPSYLLTSFELMVSL